MSIGSFKVDLGGILEESWGILGGLGEILGSWADLGVILCHFGGPLRYLRSILGGLGRILVHFGWILGYLGLSLGYLWGILG